MGNTLYYGDNLHVLREYIGNESVDLIYLDPPFNSSRNYNVLFRDKDRGAEESDAQVQAFTDFWKWDAESEDTFAALTGMEHAGSEMLADLLVALRKVLRDSDMMAYVVMMAIRLVEMRRVLKKTGSLYLHCDTVASHYLKMLLDSIFGFDSFRSEVIWKRTSSHAGAKRFAPVHDTIFFYSKSAEYTWKTQYQPLSEKTADGWYRHVDEKNGKRYNCDNLTAVGVCAGESSIKWRGVDPSAKGRHWAIPRFLKAIVGDLGTKESLDALDAAGRIVWPKKAGGQPMFKRYLEESKGVPACDVITDIGPLSPQSAERLGYPTQKPQALLERIIAASSNPGDVVLDPFCGCGTAVHAAQTLKRKWIGIDITHLAINVIRTRLKGVKGVQFEVKGEPADVAGAEKLAKDDPFQFEWWSLAAIGARPAGNSIGRQGKKGGDRGVDGVIRFRDDPSKPAQRIVVSVKGGRNLTPSMIRDLRGTMESEGAPIGVFLTMHEPTDEMRQEARRAGKWKSPTWGRDYAKVQILTIADVFAGKRVDYPGQDVTSAAVTAAPYHEIEPEPIALPGMDAPRKKGKR